MVSKPGLNVSRVNQENKTPSVNTRNELGTKAVTVKEKLISF